MGLSSSIALLGLLAAPTQAILLISSPEQNTAAPSGALAGSGWQYEGDWGSYLGTAIGPSSFVTAAHVGGNIGESFTFDGTAYTATAETTITGTDLAIWQVDGILPTYAPLYADNDEVGSGIVTFGRGVAPGAPLIVNGNAVGWNWGATDYVESWGTNTIDSVYPGGPGLGDLLTFSFNQGDPNTGILSPGDSGGGVFIENDGVWELAAVNYGIEEFYNAPPDEGGIAYSAAIYDGRGLYLSDGNYVDPAIYTDPVPQEAAASRISPNVDAIDAITGAGFTAAEPSALIVLLTLAPALATTIGRAARSWDRAAG